MTTNCPTCGSEIDWLDDLVVDLDTNVVTSGDKSTQLTPRHAEVLWIIRQRAPKTARRDALLRYYDPLGHVGDRSVDVYVHQIRKAIEGMPFKIKTVRDRGYQLVRA